MTQDTDEPEWLTAAELTDWQAFNAVLLTLPGALDAQLQRDAGLSFFEYLVLAGLSEAPERTRRMSELAALANGSLSRLSHTVARLERRGWVRRQPLPADGRITTATLTDLGYTKVVQAAPGHVTAVRRLVVDVLGADRLHQLGYTSRAIVAELGGPTAQYLSERLSDRLPAE